jgi:hypothetical protein
MSLMSMANQSAELGSELMKLLGKTKGASIKK